MRHIGLLRLYFTGSWDNAARVLPLFGSVPSLRRLRFCSFWRRFQDSDELDSAFGVSAKQLDVRLASSKNLDTAFRALCTVEFAWYTSDSEMMRERYTEFSVWVRRMLPQLHKRRAVSVYTYRCEAFLLNRESGWRLTVCHSNKFVFGLMGFSEHPGGADFQRPFGME